MERRQEIFRGSNKIVFMVWLWFHFLTDQGQIAGIWNNRNIFENKFYHIYIYIRSSRLDIKSSIPSACGRAVISIKVFLFKHQLTPSVKDLHTVDPCDPFTSWSKNVIHSIAVW